MRFWKAAFLAAAMTLPLTQCAAYGAAPSVINNAKTEEHKELFSLPLFLRPEGGFNFEKIADGCVDKAKKVELRASQIRLSYSEMLDGFSADGLKKAGMTAKNRTEFIINGSKATLFKLFQKGKGSVLGKWLLVIDKGENSWMLDASYDPKDSACSESVLKMIKSVCWDVLDKESTDSAPLGNINASGTPMRQAGIVRGAIVYTKDGKIPTKSGDGALFVVSRSKNAYATAYDQRLAFAREKMHDIENKAIVQITAENQVKIDGLNGVELIGHTDDAAKELIYITVLFDSKDAHVMAGIAKGDTLDNTDLFHNLSKTYRHGL